MIPQRYGWWLADWNWGHLAVHVQLGGLAGTQWPDWGGFEALSAGSSGDVQGFWLGASEDLREYPRLGSLPSRGWKIQRGWGSDARSLLGAGSAGLQPRPWVPWLLFFPQSTATFWGSNFGHSCSFGGFSWICPISNHYHGLTDFPLSKTIIPINQPTIDFQRLLGTFHQYHIPLWVEWTILFPLTIINHHYITIIKHHQSSWSIIKHH